MTDAENLVSEMYETLRELQYPGLTKASPGNFERTILSGENRLSLLTWLLSEETESTRETLKTLTGTALEDKLLEYYSELGICVTKESLLGKCDIKEQLSTLRFLLDFMKHVRLETFTKLEHEISVDSILKTHFEEASPTLANSQSKLTQEEATEYFANVREQLKTHAEAFEEKKQVLEEVDTEKPTDKKTSEEHNELLFTKIDNFSKLFVIPKPPSNIESEVSTSWDDQINGIHKSFARLNEVLHIGEEMAKINIQEQLAKPASELDLIIENIVITCGEAKNL